MELTELFMDDFLSSNSEAAKSYRYYRLYRVGATELSQGNRITFSLKPVYSINIRRVNSFIRQSGRTGSKTVRMPKLFYRQNSLSFLCRTNYRLV